MNKSELQVLIADDVSAMRNHLRWLLQEAGFHNITTSPNGDAAIDMVDKRHFDLIVSDWHWPSKRDGLDLLKYMRIHLENHSTPFVMLTAEMTRERVVQAIACGVDDYLIKPIVTEELRTR